MTNAGATFTINTKPVTVVTQNASKTYGDADPAPLTTADLSGFLAADNITATFSRAAGDTVGPYAITTTLVDPNNRLGNYVVTNAGATFTINTKPVTVVTQNASKTYGDADPAPLTTADLSGFLAADNITATFSRTAGDTVGPYAIATTLADPNNRLGNYVVTNAGATFTINTRPVTVITQNATKVYGDADPSPLTTADLSGFLTADNITATFSRAAGDTVGPYAITTTLVDPNNRLGNYAVTNAGATFTITQRPASVTPNAASKVFGAVDPTLTGTLNGFLASDGVTATYSRTLGETVAGSPYTISATLSPAGVLGNYAITYNTAQFTITAWTLSGFYQPVGIPNTFAGAPIAPPNSIWNTIKGGQAVPLKFELFTSTGGSELTSVTDVPASHSLSPTVR